MQRTNPGSLRFRLSMTQKQVSGRNDEHFSAQGRYEPGEQRRRDYGAARPAARFLGAVAFRPAAVARRVLRVLRPVHDRLYRAGPGRSGMFHSGAQGFFGLSDQATFAAATFAGLFIGTIVFSPMADRLGRRAIFTASLLWYTASTRRYGDAGTAFGRRTCWRFIAGIGIGVELVTIGAYIAELVPSAPARARVRRQPVRAVLRRAGRGLPLLAPRAARPVRHRRLAGGRADRRGRRARSSGSSAAAAGNRRAGSRRRGGSRGGPDHVAHRGASRGGTRPAAAAR